MIGYMDITGNSNVCESTYFYVFIFRSGLVPSREYQDKRASQSATSEDSLSSSQSRDSSNKKHSHRSLSFRRKKKVKKIMFSSAKSLEKDAEIMHCYDEVCKLCEMRTYAAECYFASHCVDHAIM